MKLKVVRQTFHLRAMKQNKILNLNRIHYFNVSLNLFNFSINSIFLSCNFIIFITSRKTRNVVENS